MKKGNTKKLLQIFKLDETSFSTYNTPFLQKVFYKKISNLNEYFVKGRTDNLFMNLRNVLYFSTREKKHQQNFTQTKEKVIIKKKMQNIQKESNNSYHSKNLHDIIDIQFSKIWENENLKLYFKNGIFEINLNRPEKLNAINRDMLNNLLNMLKSLETDSRCNLIILKSTTDKAFSAGSDVKDIILYKENGIRYLKQLYLYINYLLQIKKKVLCIWNGFVMGGGIGISIGCAIRVINKKASFAMPENKIGFFPDIGSVHFLNKYFGRNITLHLGLTGMILNEQDLINFKVATNYINDADSFLKEVYQIEYKHKDEFDEHLTRLLKKYSIENSDTNPVLSKDMINNINKYYSSANNLTELINNLKKDKKENQFCKQLLSEIESNSLFTSNFWYAYCLYNFKRNLNFKEVLNNDFKVTQYFLFHVNTFEKGVTERIIKKNKNTIWQTEDYENIIENDEGVEEVLTMGNLVSILDEFI